MNYIRTDDIEHYIRADDVERFDIKHGALTENPLGGSTTRFIANLIVDDIEADPPKGRVRRQRVNGRIVIDIRCQTGWNINISHQAALLPAIRL
jgi:hypothetical protein